MGKKEKQDSAEQETLGPLGRDSMAPKKPRLKKSEYDKVLADFQVELVKLQKWIQTQGLKVVVIFEGRDAAGKGGAIKRITQSLNPRVCRVEALTQPTERLRVPPVLQKREHAVLGADVDQLTVPLRDGEQIHACHVGEPPRRRCHERALELSGDLEGPAGFAELRSPGAGPAQGFLSAAYDARREREDHPEDGAG